MRQSLTVPRCFVLPVEQPAARTDLHVAAVAAMCPGRCGGATTINTGTSTPMTAAQLTGDAGVLAVGIHQRASIYPARPI